MVALLATAFLVAWGQPLLGRAGYSTDASLADAGEDLAGRSIARVASNVLEASVWFSEDGSRRLLEEVEETEEQNTTGVEQTEDIGGPNVSIMSTTVLICLVVTILVLPAILLMVYVARCQPTGPEPGSDVAESPRGECGPSVPPSPPPEETEVDVQNSKGLVGSSKMEEEGFEDYDGQVMQMDGSAMPTSNKWCVTCCSAW